ncbi:hypothetical protein ACWCPQ_08830 [Nocardia sp. NPDC001965]
MTSETTAVATAREWQYPDRSVCGVRPTTAPRRFGCRDTGVASQGRAPARYAWAADPVSPARNIYRPPIEADIRPGSVGGDRPAARRNVQVGRASGVEGMSCGDVVPGSELQIVARSATLISDRVNRSVFRCVRCGEFEREVEVTDPIIRSGPVTVAAVRGPRMRSTGERPGAPVECGGARRSGGAAGDGVHIEKFFTLRGSVVRRKSRFPVAGWLREFDRDGIVIAQPMDPVGGLTDSPVPGISIEKWFRCWDGNVVLMAASCAREFDGVAPESFTRTKRTGNGFRVTVIDDSLYVRETGRTSYRTRIRPVLRG